MKSNEQWESLKEESHANIQSEKGILNRQIHSIQTEGHFGDIKENDSFRRFNYRTTEKVYKEFMLYAVGRNLNKYHRFLHCKFCSNGTPILELAVHSFWFSGTRFLLKTVRFSFIIVM